jgi:hypothetical protein
MKHVLEHNLDLATSKQIAARALGEYEKRLAKYEPKIRWVDDQRAEVSFQAKGIHISGTIELRPGAVEIDLDVPFLFRAFKGPAIRVLDDELRKLIAEHQAKGQVGQAAPVGRQPLQSRP